MKTLTAEERIIFPLDLPTMEEAVDYVRLLKDHVGVFKVGLELFVACGPDVIRAIKMEAPECKVFLDMKFHDIPQTVKRAQRAASRLGVDFITVHCDEGRGLLDAAVQEAGKVAVLGVTVLTSLSKEDLLSMGIAPELADPADLVLHRAHLAHLAGLRGVVCSGLEARSVKERFGRDFLVVTPGIRPREGRVAGDDQKRVVTPYDAVTNGADYIVVGRPIRDARNPREAASAVAREIEMAAALSDA